jgi:lipopolysaccharide/colanic/teichoic acid biosynthesis glycosyltransferase
VLKGDMSLVGPRPEVPRYVAFYKAEWEAVFSVRPGITDLATLQFRDEESLLKLAENKETAYVKIVLPIKMKLALEYVEKQSIVLDLKILFLTVWSITLGRFLAQPENELAELAKKRILEFTKRYKKTANGNTIF